MIFRLQVMSHFILIFLCVFLSETEAALLLARDGFPANHNNRLSAKHALLLLRQNIVYCAETYYSTYCVDTVCCGIYNCMPADAECCSNGQYCLAGTACEWKSDVMTCQCVGVNCSNDINSSPKIQTAVTTTMTTTAATSSSTYTPPASTPTPSPSTSNSGGGKGLSSGTLAGIGSVAGILSCFIAVWVCICYQRRGNST